MNHSTAPFASTKDSTFTPETRVGEIVATHPLAGIFFERVGIDYCCGGKKSLADACRAKGLDPATVAIMLEVATRSANPSSSVNPAAMSLTQLADHIEQSHHAYLKEELPIMLEQAERVAMKHGEREPAVREVAAIVRDLTEEMFQHMRKEERILFPLVRQLEAGGSAAAHCGSIANPIRQMESEHDDAGGMLARLRELTNGFVPSPEACNTHRALLAGLARLEGDLHQHVHKENNILFPRAIALEAQRETSATPARA